MKIVQNEVLLIKSNEGSDAYKDMLKHNGYNVKQLSAIDFNFINSNLLENALTHPELYSGLILTSPRSITAIKKVLLDNELLKEWRKKENFGVGEKTCKLAFNELQLECSGADCGHTENLAENIIKKSYKNALLFPCGNLAHDYLPKLLHNNHIGFEKIIVYETIANTQFESQFKELTSNYEYFSEFCVFFSPSAVKFSIELINKLKNVFDQIKCIAFGPSTRNELCNHKIPMFGSLEKPNPICLLNLLQSS